MDWLPLLLHAGYGIHPGLGAAGGEAMNLRWDDTAYRVWMVRRHGRIYSKWMTFDEAREVYERWKQMPKVSEIHLVERTIKKIAVK
jgi:hypothetical protein